MSSLGFFFVASLAHADLVGRLDLAPSAIVPHFLAAFKPPASRFEVPMPITERLYFRELVERKQQISTILSAWAQDGRIPLFVLPPAAPGSGKSHLLWTIAARGALPPDGDGRRPESLDGEWQRAVDECSPAFRQQLDESIGVTVSFNTMADIDVDLEQKSSASTLIACRMLHSHFAAASSGLGRPLPYRDLLKFLMAHRLRR